MTGEHVALQRRFLRRDEFAMVAVEEVMKRRMGGSFVLIDARLSQELATAFVAQKLPPRSFLVVNLPMTAETGDCAESLSTLGAGQFRG